MNPNTKKLLGALVAAAVAIAAFYGVISQQQATSIQNQANQALGTAPANAPANTPTAQQGAATNAGGAPLAPSQASAPAVPAPQAPAVAH